MMGVAGAVDDEAQELLDHLRNLVNSEGGWRQDSRVGERRRTVTGIMCGGCRHGAATKGSIDLVVDWIEDRLKEAYQRRAIDLARRDHESVVGRERLRVQVAVSRLLVRRSLGGSDGTHGLAQHELAHKVVVTHLLRHRVVKERRRLHDTRGAGAERIDGELRVALEQRLLRSLEPRAHHVRELGLGLRSGSQQRAERIGLGHDDDDDVALADLGVHVDLLGHVAVCLHEALDHLRRHELRLAELEVVLAPIDDEHLLTGSQLDNVARVVPAVLVHHAGNLLLLAVAAVAVTASGVVGSSTKVRVALLSDAQRLDEQLAARVRLVLERVAELRHRAQLVRDARQQVALGGDGTDLAGAVALRRHRERAVDPAVELAVGHGSTVHDAAYVGAEHTLCKVAAHGRLGLGGRQRRALVQQHRHLAAKDRVQHRPDARHGREQRRAHERNLLEHAVQRRTLGSVPRREADASADSDRGNGLAPLGGVRQRPVAVAARLLGLKVRSVELGKDVAIEQLHALGIVGRATGVDHGHELVLGHRLRKLELELLSRRKRAIVRRGGASGSITLAQELLPLDETHSVCRCHVVRPFGRV